MNREKSSEKSVIVFGPQGCGKHRQAEAMRRYFRLDHVRDLDEHGVRPITGTLYLTNLSRLELQGRGVIDQHVRRVHSFDEAMLLLARPRVDLSLPRNVAQAQHPTPPAGTPGLRARAGNSTPPRAPVVGVDKSERVGERDSRK
jgi:hypothetical protein